MLRSLQIQRTAPISPAEKVNSTKTLFDMAFTKNTWLVQPLILAFLTLMVPCDDKQTGMLVLTAPVNHNKLNQNKAIEIVNTILGNAYQSNIKLTRQNQDFGLDTCMIIGYNDKKLREIPGRNKVIMKALHPEDGGLHEPYNRSMIPSADHKITTILQSDEFQQLLKTDATTSEGQDYVAQYFGVHKQWESTKQTITLRSYYELLCLVKQTIQSDYIWISFWDGMHRYAAIRMSLLCADITYNINNCYVPRTLTSHSFSTAQIKGYQNPHLEPEEIIQEFFDGTRTDTPLLKPELTITAYVSIMQVKEIEKIMEVTRTQSQYVSEN
jgi:hypothetical protein